MLRLRFLFAWFLMAAVPLQGFAAASMVLCGEGAQHMHTPHAAAPHDHAAMHGHASGDVQDHASTLSDLHSTSSDVAQAATPDAAHTCSICASCCNGVALLMPEQLIAMAPAPQSELAEPFVLIHTRPSPVPDKPPRA